LAENQGQVDIDLGLERRRKEQIDPTETQVRLIQPHIAHVNTLPTPDI